MRKSKIHLILLLTLLLAGCAPAAAAETPTPLPSRTASQTAVPTRTASSTMTLTPLPFNACPATDEEYRYPFPEEVDETEKLAGDILEALNHGMTLTNLQNSLSQIEIIGDMFPPQTSEGKPLPYLNTFAQDLTGDGVEEIVFINRKIENFLLPWTLHVFSCQQGKYAMTFHQNFDEFESYDLRDLNNNGIPEIIFHHYYLPMQGPWLLYIFEWDGDYFRNLIPSSQVSHVLDYPGAYVKNPCYEVESYNLRNEGAYDVILRGRPCGFGDVYGTGPYRAYTVVLSWDGTFFQPGYEELDPPTYLFQAVQDGDRETMRGDYEKALAFYNQALNDPNLKGWSEELYHQQWDTFYSLNEELPTPTPAPADPNEREILTAYVHYRLMLIVFKAMKNKPKQSIGCCQIYLLKILDIPTRDSPQSIGKNIKVQKARYLPVSAHEDMRIKVLRIFMAQLIRTGMGFKALGDGVNRPGIGVIPHQWKKSFALLSKTSQ